VAGSLAEEAARRGVTPQALALDYLRALIAALPTGSLLKYLGARVRSVVGTGKAHTQEAGKRFADGLAVDIGVEKA
jgi:hypothetical protein